MATELTSRMQDDLSVAQLKGHAAWDAIQRMLDQMEQTHLENLVNEENPKERGIVLAVRELRGEFDRMMQRGTKVAEASAPKKV